MLTSLVLLLIFTLLGYPLTQKNSTDRLLLAPVLGLATSVFTAYILSMNFNLNGADSMGLALCLLIVIGLYIEWRTRLSTSYTFLKQELLSPFLAGIPVLILIAPALYFGIENFFGVVNFDFFYNSQESWYLSTHSVLEFSPSKNTSILPLDWSANQQGRFAISLVGAFAFKFFDINPLHFNSALLSSLLMIGSFTAMAFARRVLGLNIYFSALAAGVYTFSAGSAQGYIYYLLGQISAIPLLIAICIFTNDLLSKLNNHTYDRKSLWPIVAALMVLLNALYVFYAILSVFAIAIIMTASFFNGIHNKHFSFKSLTYIVLTLAASACAFLVFRITSFVETKQILLEWIALSLKTANNPQVDGIIHLSEYLSEANFSLLLGIFVYPTSNSILNDFIGSGYVRSILMLVIGLLALLSFFSTIIVFVKDNTVKKSNISIILALVAISFSAGILFCIIKSAYAMFKVGCWLIPSLLMVPAASLYYARALPYRLKNAVTVMAFFLIAMNVITALNYSYVFFSDRMSGRFTNPADLNVLRGITSLKNWLALYPDRPLALDLNDGIKAAWVANEFRDHKVNALTHNYQPLEDRILPDTPCLAQQNTFPTDSLLVTDRKWVDNTDIVTISPEYVPIYSSNQYLVYDLKNVAHYAFLGRGSYTAYTLGSEAAAKHGLPATFRWIEKGVELYVYSKEPSIIDIGFDIAPGYVTHVEPRNIRLKAKDLDLHAQFVKGPTHLTFKSIPVTTGISCFYLDSPDKVERLPRYGAIFRSDVPLDYRFLNYALGNITIHFKKREP